MRMNETQFQEIKELLQRLVAREGSFYQKKYQGIDIEGIRTQEDFETLPFTNKDELREGYPVGIDGGR